MPSVVCVRSFVPKLKNSASRDLVGHKRGPWNFNHRPYQIVKFRLSLLSDCVGDTADDFDLKLQLARKSHQRNHDLRTNLDAFALHLRGGLKNGARLHFRNLRVNNAEAATAMAEHRVKFVQLVHPTGNVLYRHAEFVRKFVLLGVIVWQELMKRWIEKADRCRQAF